MEVKMCDDKNKYIYIYKTAASNLNLLAIYNALASHESLGFDQNTCGLDYDILEKSFIVIYIRTQLHIQI